MRDVLLDRHREDPLGVREILPELIDGLPGRYLSFEEGDHETFFRLMQIDPETWPARTVGSWKSKVTQSGGGIVIRRYDVAGTAGPPPYARFDNDVVMRDPKIRDAGNNIVGHRSRDSITTHYMYPPRRPKRPWPKEIDVHPLAKVRHRRDLFWTKDTDIYFAMEGSLKADALLSAGWPAISSTSVTTWEGQSLKAMVGQLRDARTVYVVPDSDFLMSDKMPNGFFNPMVRYNACALAQWLSNRGVNAQIAIPWLGPEYHEKEGKLGADDFLHRGYRIEELVSVPAFAEALYMMPSVPVTRNEERVLKLLLKRYGPAGAFYPGEIAKSLRIDRKTVWRAYRRFEELQIMTVWVGHPRQRGGGGFANQPDWYVSYQLITGYRAYLDTLFVPPPVRRKLGMDTWRS